MSAPPTVPTIAALAALLVSAAGAGVAADAPVGLRTVTQASSDAARDDLLLLLPSGAFRRGSAALVPTAQQKLETAAAGLDDLRGRVVSIVGIGRTALAERRARAVRAHLVGRGLSPDALRTRAVPAPHQPFVELRIVDEPAAEW